MSFVDGTAAPDAIAVDAMAAAQAWLLDMEAFGIELLPRRVAGESAAVAAAAPSTQQRAPVQPTAPSTQRTATTASAVERSAALQCVAAEAAACSACGLATGRTQVVPGQGAATARLMFVGEAPGAEEDRTGLAFVGEAGQLLTRMIQAMGLQREDVFIANVLKCRPPENREPAVDEAQACRGFLLRQLAIVDPDVIVALGAHAARNLLQLTGPLGAMRGKVHTLGRAQVVATYHPSYLLRSPDMKRAAWQDLKFALSLLPARDGA